MPGAARKTDMHACPQSNPGPVPHVGMMISEGSGNVLINGLGAAREGDGAICVGGTDSISTGSSSVLINGMAAARMGDPTDHGGAITAGSATVLIGG
ncbi:MAG: PAAR domain-containing protein [Crocinitomicaceae bacterium]|nr:PAAR domain-containing protein [Crocinitomicaceae bacterium]